MSTSSHMRAPVNPGDPAHAARNRGYRHGQAGTEPDPPEDDKLRAQYFASYRRGRESSRPQVDA